MWLPLTHLVILHVWPYLFFTITLDQLTLAKTFSLNLIEIVLVPEMPVVSFWGYVTTNFGVIWSRV